MHQQQWQRPASGDLPEWHDALPVHVDRDLPKRIQPGLTRRPVKSGSPGSHSPSRSAARPVRRATARELVEAPGTGQPGTQVIQLALWA